ncbi:MAG: Zn-ribbon domain-containing OB-fold protein [Microthrixaceae bacterium]|nr:Zn-ribbon domain-containing OB-fold protein [Microthrixaceae bacterium]
MPPADNDRQVTPFPAGLWEQPQPVVPAAVAEVAEPVQRIRVPASMLYRYTPGAAPSRFLRGLRDKRILGEKDPVNGDVYVPPRGMSPVVGLPTTEQVELPDRGTLAAFCIVHIGFGVNAPPTPFVSALVLIDGAAVSVYGTLLDIPIEEVRIGMRVQAVWAPDEELTTSFENIRYWKPLDEPDVAPELLKGHM